MRLGWMGQPGLVVGTLLYPSSSMQNSWLQWLCEVGSNMPSGGHGCVSAEAWF